MKIGIYPYKVFTSKTQSFRLCHFSDLHFWEGYKKERLESILEKVKELQPTYICVTGDLLDQASVSEKKEITCFLAFFKKLSNIAKVLVILGNHDQTIFEKKQEKYIENALWKRKLKEIPNVYLLENDMYEDACICCYGYAQDPSTFKEETREEDIIIKDLQKKIPVPNSDKFYLVLMHSPLVVARPKVQKALSVLEKVDLILCGHTHGGIMPISFKGNRGLVSAYKNPLPKYARGKIEGRAPIIVHHGIIKLSKMNGFFHTFNFLFPIHLNQIEINPKNTEK